uniref:Ubiquitin carboxyl-terminal hydrolase n=1 Tax=Electrophorus electricus TaxID=8005 RepID=A0A4W4GWW9_ELEEL
VAVLFSQYIFGEFSPDEFNQFFLTPRCYVELPPFNDKSNKYSLFVCADLTVLFAGEDYQHIEFGVDEVMSSEPVAVKDPLYKVSSTLNPQAPEFILGCQPAQKAPPTTAAVAPGDVPHGTHFNSVDCADSEASAQDSHQVCSDLDGMGGALGQRERKKKKKRPPGYYNYLEGSGSGGGSMAMDGVASPGLVNGHALSAPVLVSEDTIDETLAGTDSAPIASAPPGDRTVDRCVEPEPSGKPELQVGMGGGGHSPRPTSPPSAAMVTAPATTDEGDVEGQANGLPEPAPSADGTAHGLRDSSETGEVQQGSALVQAPSDLQVQPGAEQATSLAPAAVPAPNPPKSWASLFHNSKPLPGGPQAYVEVKNTTVAAPTSPAAGEQPQKMCEAREGPVPVSEDPMAPKLAELIENVKLIHKPVSLQPRGLINTGNWCYINATLQALIACPPMYHLMKSIPLFTETQRPCTSTPMMDNFVRLVNEFSNMPVPSKAKQQAAGEKLIKDIRPGVPFEPTYIYRLLTLIKSSLSEKGRQEDAEEYLGFTLNGLHEEMLALKKLISPQEESGFFFHYLGEEEAEEGNEDEWEQVGPRNKTSITRQADFIRTPITDIFGGHIRSVVYQQSSKESATLQLFFTLQLDIQSEKIRTVQEALESMVAREAVQGYTTKSKQEIEISRRVTLEELPPVLVLHLKRFVFEKTGGCQKLVKNIDYPVDLEISKDLLSPGVRSKTLKGQRTYRLFAVVYHHGNSATGGHYTTDVFHIGLNGWLRIDDQAVKVTNQYHVVKQTSERTAYLLYYRRVDLL